MNDTSGWLLAYMCSCRDMYSHTHMYIHTYKHMHHPNASSPKATMADYYRHYNMRHRFQGHGIWLNDIWMRQWNLAFLILKFILYIFVCVCVLVHVHLLCGFQWSSSVIRLVELSPQSTSAFLFRISNWCFLSWLMKSSLLWLRKAQASLVNIMATHTPSASDCKFCTGVLIGWGMWVWY